MDTLSVVRNVGGEGIETKAPLAQVFGLAMMKREGRKHKQTALATGFKVAGARFEKGRETVGKKYDKGDAGCHGGGGYLLLAGADAGGDNDGSLAPCLFKDGCLLLLNLIGIKVS